MDTSKYPEWDSFIKEVKADERYSKILGLGYTEEEIKNYLLKNISYHNFKAKSAILFLENEVRVNAEGENVTEG